MGYTACLGITKIRIICSPNGCQIYINGVLRYYQTLKITRYSITFTLLIFSPLCLIKFCTQHAFNYMGILRLFGANTIRKPLIVNETIRNKLRYNGYTLPVSKTSSKTYYMHGYICQPFLWWDWNILLKLSHTMATQVEYWRLRRSPSFTRNDYTYLCNSSSCRIIIKKKCAVGAVALDMSGWKYSYFKWLGYP